MYVHTVHGDTLPKYSTLIFKGKVLVMALIHCRAKHILGLGPGNVQNIFGNIWNVFGNPTVFRHVWVIFKNPGIPSQVQNSHTCDSEKIGMYNIRSTTLHCSWRQVLSPQYQSPQKGCKTAFSKFISSVHVCTCWCRFTEKLCNFIHM